MLHVCSFSIPVENSTSPSHRISIYFSYILRPPLEARARHSQECFFLREEVLIYDAPESATFPRMFPFVASKYCEAMMHPVYHAKITISTKNLPPLEGRALHTSLSHRISIYFSDILPCRFNSFTRSLKVSTLPILEGKRLAGNLASVLPLPSHYGK